MKPESIRAVGPQLARLALTIFLSASFARGGAIPGDVSTAPSQAIPSRHAAQDFSVHDDELAGLIAILLDENPAIRRAWGRSRLRFERVPQARSLPDPQLSFRYFARPPETRVGPQEQTLELSQGLPWRGKRDLQADRARQLATSEAWAARDLERNLVADVKKAYFEAAYLQEALVVNSEERELLQRFEAIALKRYATGQGIQQSVIKVQTDISRLEDREVRLRERLDATVRRIAELIGRPDLVLDLARIDLEDPVPLPDSDVLERTASYNHPRVRAAEQRIEADRTWSRRRMLDTRPDLRLGLGYTRVDERDDTAGRLNPPEDNGNDILAFTVGINLPVFRKSIRAGVAEAEESVRSGQDHLQSVRNRLRYEIQEAMLRLNALDERGRLYDGVIIPQAEESLASAEAAYVTNRQTFLDLLDAERVLFEARLTRHRLASDYWVALADLEFVVGHALFQASPDADSPERDAEQTSGEVQQ